jgi:hypothetical protein
MTAAMILKEIHALPLLEKRELLSRLEQDVNQPGGARLSEHELLDFVNSIGRRLRTSLTVDEMNAARHEGRE